MMAERPRQDDNPADKLGAAVEDKLEGFVEVGDILQCTVQGLVQEKIQGCEIRSGLGQRDGNTAELGWCAGQDAGLCRFGYAQLDCCTAESFEGRAIDGASLVEQCWAACK